MEVMFSEQFDNIASLKLSKLAKEKGFNVCCDNIYVNGKLLHNLRKKLLKESDENSGVIIWGPEETIDAPNLYTLQHWLIRVHKIILVIHPSFKNKEHFYYSIYKEREFIKGGSNKYSYIKALEEGLENALNILT